MYLFHNLGRIEGNVCVWIIKNHLEVCWFLQRHHNLSHNISIDNICTKYKLYSTILQKIKAPVCERKHLICIFNLTKKHNALISVRLYWDWWNQLRVHLKKFNIMKKNIATSTRTICIVYVYALNQFIGPISKYYQMKNKSCFFFWQLTSRSCPM
jgi:hypothetical protein